MILSREDIRAAVESGSIVFDPPLEEKQYGEASVDLRLGFSFTKFRPTKELESITLSVADGLGTIGDLQIWKTQQLVELDEHGNRQHYVLKPKDFVLALTLEKITVPPNMIALIEGRSTYARVGISMHQTAPWIQPGWSGQITLEIMNHGPLNIALTPKVDRPCQLVFIELKTALDQSGAYGSRPEDRYQNQEHPLKHKT